jgi:hypothetical protein
MRLMFRSASLVVAVSLIFWAQRQGVNNFKRAIISVASFTIKLAHSVLLWGHGFLQQPA